MKFGTIFLLACRQRFLKPEDAAHQAAAKRLDELRQTGGADSDSVDLAEAIAAACPLLCVFATFVAIAIAGRIFG